MKYLLFINLLFLSVIISSQDIPPALKIKNATTKWQHMVVDDNFELDTFGLNDQNKFNCCVALNFDLFDSTLIVNNFCKNRIGDPHGYILQGIDIFSGKLKWQSIANNDNGLKDQEAYPYIYHRKDGHVDLLGFRKLGLPLTTFPGWRADVPSVPIRRIFDIETGQLISRDTDESDTVGINTPWLNGIMMPLTENKYAQVTNFLKDYQFYFKLRTMGLDPYNFDGLTHPTVQFTSDIPITVTSFSWAYNVFARYGEHSIVGLVTQQDQPTIGPLRTKVMKINMVNNSGEPDFELEFEKNIENKIKLPYASNGNFARINTHNGLIFISMVYLASGPKVKSWLLCLDSLGNEVFYIPSFELNETKNYTAFNLIGIQNNEIYFLCQPNSSGKGADIVKVTLAGEIKFLGSYESESPDHKLSNMRAIFTNFNEIIFSTVINSTYSYVAAFDPKDFNIDLTSTTEETNVINLFELQPNPSIDRITITIPEIHHAQSIYITDQTGRCVLQNQVSGNITEMDISPLQAGMYFVSLTDDAGRSIGRVEKLVKL